MSAGDDLDQQLRLIFSNPRAETLEGVLAVGGKMNPDLLFYAYNHGVFPWPHEGYPLLWFCPDERGVIDFLEIRMPRTFKKWLSKTRGEFTITMNKAFEDVLRGCKMQKRKGQKGTWINQEIEKNYIQLHKLDRAISLEVWREQKLVGGIYGVKSLKYFSLESMFHTEDNASKLALYELLNHLQNLGQTWVDIQMVTDVCQSFGGRYISKKEFLKRIGF